MSPASVLAGTAAAIDPPIPDSAVPPAAPSASLPATLPALAPSPPAPGRKEQLAALPVGADALALAQLAVATRREGRTLAIVCADALAVQRLADEIAWFAPALAVAQFPDWETLPYDHFSPHQDLVSARLAALYRVTRKQCDVVLVAAQTALYRQAPLSYLAAHTFFLTTGETLDVDALRAQLGLAGYSHVTQVVSPGEFSVRGGLIDLFPMGSALPYRIDLFGDDIESIKTFDVDSQRTLYPVKDIRMLPAREFPLDEPARARFRSRFRESFEGDPSKSPLYKDISHGVVPGGIEYYLPLFFDATATFADYLARDTVVALHGDVAAAIERFWQDTEARWKLLRGDKARPLLPPHDLFLTPDEFNGSIKPFGRVALAPLDPASAEPVDAPVRRLPQVQVDRRADDPLAALKRAVEMFEGRVMIAAESAGRRETMQQYLAAYGMHPVLLDDFAAFGASDARLALVVSPLSAGFVWPAAKLAFVTEAELYANVVRRARRDAARRSNVDAMVRDLSEVRIGDPVVHEQHGIGRYLGLVTLDVGDGATEFLELLYANDAKLYVPVSSLHLIG
ncbi:MAG TPA: CarD family transcriptional regulator, partial [Casimicrobiaceae bacterium]|nr:CarD family transcriptional regulator [Casimicrobiaceae bacterium]